MEPGKGYGGYLHLSEIVEKGNVPFRGRIIAVLNKLVFVDGRPIQGLTVYTEKGLVGIKGIHYTSWERATQIRSTRSIIPSLVDPFVYISEPNKMSGWPENAIKKELGTSAADTEVQVIVIVPIHQVWIKVTRYAVHFAITGLIADEELTVKKIKRRE